MSKLIDISVPVSPDMAHWPGSPKVIFDRRLDMDSGDVATDTNLFCSVHTGTHVDAPSHFVSDGKTVDFLSLEILTGICQVVDVGKNTKEISAGVLDHLNIVPGVTRLLLKTGNSAYWKDNYTKFQKEFSALTECGAQWMVDHRIRLVGIDYMSIQRYEDGPETHHILLANEVIIVEGLNLGHISPGEYELFCLPLKLKGLEGAPARAILREVDQ